MKIKKLIKLLEVIDGKLPSDMQVLPEYIYDGDKTKAPIGDMDFVHFVRAFVKMNSYDSDLDKSVSDINHEEDIKQNYVRKDVYEMLFDKCEKLERTIDALVRENRRKLQENYELRHPRYVFSEIPNDCDGQRFTDDLKKYLNKGTYRMRVRGQHVKEEYKGTGVTAYGQNIEQSTHLRVYIEEKD